MTSAPLILVVDTSHGACSVAVTEGTNICAQSYDATPNKQAERLLGMIDTTLTEANLTPADLTHLVATVGPGSFTGVRIGLSALLGMHIALPHTHTAGVTTLECIAAEARSNAITAQQPTTLAVLNAMRGQVYVQSFNTETQHTLTEGALVNLEDFNSIATGFIASNCPELLRDMIPACAQLSETSYSIHAWRAAAIIACKTAYGQPLPPMEPVYIRPPDAKKPTLAAAPY